MERTYPLFLIVGFILSACGGIPNKNVDQTKNNQATFRKDLRECQQDYPEAASGVHIRQWQGCMELKGWR